MYRKIINKLKDKKIAILGFGREGKSTYKFIRKYLPEKELTILDINEINITDQYTNVITGKTYLKNLDIYDFIIKTPGISLKDIKDSNILNKITSQLELLLEVYKDNVIGITGTKGKSTTSSLLYEVIKKQKESVYLLGNIGTPVFDNIEEYNKDTILVVEMSSHQLEYIKVSPHIAIILNLFEDHLDHAGTLEHYHANKMNIFKYQTKKDYSLYAEDNFYLNERINSYNYQGIKYSIRFDDKYPKKNGVQIHDKNIILNDETLYEDKDRFLKGEHNLKNIMFVVTVAKILGLDLEQASQIIYKFKGLKYRMEYIGTYDNISYYNDTIATIPEATINAIKTIKNVDTLIFGGMDRKIDYKDFILFLKASSINNFICMPSTGTKIGKILERETKKNIYFVDNLEDAYKISKEKTEKDKSCLLSPAASSYEYFKNFEEKGKIFERLVKKADKLD
ncbi:MAG: UDP-N-acetylmuramoyl-L-alanine--D-glutamate ligase [Bacilli bacterium]|nr:UDP-N-acetylmuramoyl-L-alanine--D-glutamate ligase [Bacilli bacterium]